MIRLQEDLEEIDPEEERLRALKQEQLRVQRATAAAKAAEVAQAQAATQAVAEAETDGRQDEVIAHQHLAAVVREEEQAQVRYRVDDDGDGALPSRPHSVAQSAKDTLGGSFGRQRKTIPGPSSYPKSAVGRSRQTPTPEVKDTVSGAANPWFQPLTTMQPNPLQNIQLSPGVSMVEVATGRGKSVAMQPVPRQMTRQEYMASTSPPREENQGCHLGSCGTTMVGGGQSNAPSASLVLAGLAAGGSVGSLGAINSAPPSPASKLQQQFQTLAPLGNRPAGPRTRTGATVSSSGPTQFQGTAYGGGPVRVPRPVAVIGPKEKKMGGTIVSSNKELLQSLFGDH